MADKLFAFRPMAWYAAVGLTALSFTWSERWSTIGIVLMIALWLADPGWWSKVNLFFQSPFTTNKRLMLVMVLFFLYHIVGLLWSNEPGQGWQSVEVKLSFFLLPLLFATEDGPDRKQMNILGICFSASLVCSFSYSFFSSYMAFHAKGWDYVLSRMNISAAIMHPGYYSNYFALALVWSVLLLKDGQLSSTGRKVLHSFFVVFMLLALLLLISKTAILFIATFFTWLLWLLAGQFQQGLKRWGIFLFFLAGLVILSSLLPSIRNRIQETSTQFKPVDQSISIENSTGSRRVAWKLEAELIRENGIAGYGTGEANARLSEQLIQHGYLRLAADHMHTHNQVMHTWIDLGLPGLLLLMAFLLFAFHESLRQGHTLAGWLVVLIAWNLVTDDMLEIQAGTVFFIFFLGLFLFRRQETAVTN